MSTALFAVPGILAPLQGLFRWFAAAGLPSRSAVPPAKTDAIKADTIKSIASYAYQTRARGINSSQNRVMRTGTLRAQSARSAASAASAASATSGASGALAASPRPAASLASVATLVPASPVLRVMRVLEAGQAPASVGRMVISGRMADVCAELDRLAARAALSH